VARATSPRADADSTREYARRWLSHGNNRERAKASLKRRLAASGGSPRERQNAMDRFGRAVARMAAAPRHAPCKICGDSFEVNWRGRPRVYCEKCTLRYTRTSRTCPGCGATMTVSRRRLTCKSCGALWGRRGDGKI